MIRQNRLLSLLLALVMILGMIPVSSLTALAADGDSCESGTHVYTGDCDTQCDACGYIRDVSIDHTEGTPANCKHPAVCAVCGSSYGETVGEHSIDENGKCAVCETQFALKYKVSGSTEEIYIEDANNAWNAFDTCVNGGGGTICLFGDVVVSKGVDAIWNQNLTVILNGYTVNFSKRGLVANQGALVTIDASKGGTLDGRNSGTLGAMSAYNTRDKGGSLKIIGSPIIKWQGTEAKASIGWAKSLDLQEAGLGFTFKNEIDDDLVPIMNEQYVLINCSTGEVLANNIVPEGVTAKIANPHTHAWVYSATDNVITAYCNNQEDPCRYCGEEKAVALTLTADGGAYTGKGYTASIENNIPTVAGDVSDISYYKVNTEGATTGGTLVDEAKNVGYYYATVTLASKTASVAFTITTADLKNATVSAENAIYSGAKLTPNVTVTLNGVELIKDTDYTVSYSNNIAVGTATVTVKGIGNCTGEATGSFNIDYLADTPDATISGTAGTDGWYLSGVTLTAPAGYTICSSVDGTYSNSYTLNDEQNGTVTYYLKNTNGQIAEKMVGVKIDTTVPTAQYKIGENDFKEFTDTTSSVCFYKDGQTVQIAANDSNSGVKTTQYYIADEELSDTEFTSVLWSDYEDTLSLDANGTYFIYVKIVDNAGNTVVYCSDSIVIFADSTANVEIEYTKTTQTDVTAEIAFNGNTVKEVAYGKTVLKSGTDYTVTETGICFASSFLETLPASDTAHEVTVSYNAGGEAWGEGSYGAAPADTVVTITVKLADGSISDVSDISKTYDGDVVSNATYNSLSTGEATYEYKLFDADDDTYTKTAPKDAGKYIVRITVAADENYGQTSTTAEFTIDKKTVGINWDTTSFVYDGTGKVPTATATGVESDDEIALTVEGEKVDANKDGGTYTATVTDITGEKKDNYRLPDDGTTTTFTIAKADQTAPSGLVGTPEDIDGRENGTITGLTDKMEYRKNEETTYTDVTGTELVGLADGTYYIRYKADDNHTVSPETTIVLSSDKKLMVAVPETQVGYTLTVDKAELKWNESATLTFALKDGYSELSNFAIRVNNGEPIPLTAGQYTIANAQTNCTITVEGVADITAPIATITLGDNSWDKFWNNITFDLFFKDAQEVEITAEDVNTGSGLDKIYYYLATSELTEQDAKDLEDDSWTEYKGTFNINPQEEYIIYAKATDKSGNAIYISSEKGIVVDDIAPVISGIADGETHYGDTTFSVTDKHIDFVTVDDDKETLTDNKYTITADGAVHTVVATDKSGNNSEEVQITVITIASLDDSIDGITTDNVKSSDKKAVQDVLDFVNTLISSDKDFTDTEDKQLADMKANAETLLEKISEVAEKVADLTAKVNAYDIDKVKSDDKGTINGLIAEINTLLNGDNLTEAEKSELAEVKANAEVLLEKISEVAEKVADLTAKVNAYDIDEVNSDDEETINGLIAEIDTLLNGDNLTEAEKSELTKVKTTAEELVEKINETEKVFPDFTTLLQTWIKILKRIWHIQNQH